MTKIEISEVEIIPVKPKDGIFAFVSCIVDKKFYFSSIAIKSERDGKFKLSFPAKKLNDRNIHYYYPLNREVYAQMLAAFLPAIETLIEEKME